MLAGVEGLVPYGRFGMHPYAHGYGFYPFLWGIGMFFRALFFFLIIGLLFRLLFFRHRWGWHGKYSGCGDRWADWKKYYASPTADKPAGTPKEKPNWKERQGGGPEGEPADEESAAEETFADHLLEYPHYTRPALWQGRAVPEVLTSGHHEEIRRWRKAQAERITKERRPDLWARHVKDEDKSRG